MNYHFNKGKLKDAETKFRQKYSQILLGKKMIIAKSRKDLDRMREVGELIAEVREALRSMIKPGITTLELNAVAEKMMRDAVAIPTFIGYKPHGMVPFPYAICASVNDQIVHGFSSDIPLKEGDIISIDMAATYNGFVGDTATTIPVGEVSDELKQLIRTTDECLALGIEQCRVNKRVGDIGAAVQQHAEAHGALCYFASVGIANSEGTTEEEMSVPVKGVGYNVQFDGLIKMARPDQGRGQGNG